MTTRREGKNAAQRARRRAARRPGRSLAANPKPFSAQVAFAAAGGSIAVVPAAGGPVVRLTTPRPAGRREPTRTDLLAGRRHRRLHAGAGHGRLRRLPGRERGSGLRRLTATPRPADPGEARTGSSALAWSPDGSGLLAFRHDRFAVVAADGGGETTLARVGVQYELGSALWHLRRSR